ncbi:G0/G1 switch protein 2-like [Myxocyprinus asiaticus]|uniref:G0/G1 switch protein 2-like n=1 Tax=Myxocyprinus asiaticus TaxID=70543 RepID=UPI0022219DE3|nr:G0/G1 switch protein 2-like [Myxocyprinus asiaticus]
MDIMETVREIIPFVMEILRQKASRGVLKVYLLGSVLALLGCVLGLLELFYMPFTFVDPLDPERGSLMAWIQEPEAALSHREKKLKLTGLRSEKATRTSANRLHTS